MLLIIVLLFSISIKKIVMGIKWGTRVIRGRWSPIIPSILMVMEFPMCGILAAPYIL